MNEFYEFLLLIWRVVTFFWDLASHAICTVLALAACALPWRAVALARAVSNDHVSRTLCVCEFCRTLFEVACLAVCLPSLVIPSRAVGFVTLLMDEEQRERFTRYDSCPLYAFYWLRSPVIGLAEVVAFAFGLLALLSVVRSKQLVTETWSAIEESDDWDSNFFCPNVLGVMLRNGATVAIDVVFLPMLLMLLLTVWRAPPAVRALRGELNWMTRAVIFRQFMWLLADLLLVLPSTFLVTLTLYRLPVLIQRVRTEDGEERRRTEDTEENLFRAACMEQGGVEYHERFGEACGSAFQLSPTQRVPMRAAGLVLLDVLCLPMILMLFLTGYRLCHIACGLPGTAFHSAVLEQFKELVLDVPFLLAGLVVLCSVYRADLALKLCEREAGTAWERRQAVALQFLCVLGDLASLVPLALVVGTLYRLCPLVLALKARMAQILRAEPELRVHRWSIDVPPTRGRPRFVVQATKSPNLCGVTSMHIQVAGDAFWAAVAEAHGSLKAAIGRVVLPLELRDAKEVTFDAVRRGQSEVELVVELGASVQQSSVLRFLRKLPQDVEVLLQVEAGLNSGRHVVLLALLCTVGALAEAVSSNGSAQAGHEADPAPEESLAALRGAPKMARDAWCPAVLAEFLHLAIDLVHVLIALALLVTPWRFTLAVRRCLEPSVQAQARAVRRVAVALGAWNSGHRRLVSQVECLANRYAKAAVEERGATLCGRRAPKRRQPRNGRGNLERCAEECVGCLCCVVCHCCMPCWRHPDSWLGPGVAGDAQQPLAQGFDAQLRQLGGVLHFQRNLLRAARKFWPQEPQWAQLVGAIDAHLWRQSETYFWVFLLHEVHILMALGRVTREEHARVAQAVRNRALPIVQRAEEESNTLQKALQAAQDAGTDSSLAEHRRGCAGKSKELVFSVLRDQLAKAASDLFAAPLLLLLLVTLYRLPRVHEDAGHKPDFAQVKAVVIRQAGLLLQDTWLLVQLLLLTGLLVATVVKLPDFLLALRPSRGLHKARDCALAALTDVFVGLGELLLMVTAWKTYKVLVLAAAFALLSPAAMLATALPGGGARTRGRFAVACLGWLALMLAGCVRPSVGVALAMAGLMTLAFAGYCLNGVAGWVRPRRRLDWWSPTVRLTLPNCIALLAVVSDAVALVWVGAHEAQMHAAGEAGSSRAPTVAALVTVVMTVLLETVPMVSDEDEQADVVCSSGWRLASALLKEVLLLPVAAALAPAVQGHRLACLALLFYSAVVCMGPSAWDFDTPHTAQLDIRSVGLAASSRCLLLVGAVLAGAAGQHSLFIALVVVCVAWVLLWLPYGCSAAWPEVLRIGAYLGAVAAASGESTPAVVTIWVVAVALALAVALGSDWLRRRRLAASEVPAAMVELAEIQERLCLWGGEPLPALRADADVRSTAERLLEFEERLPIERLDPAFLFERSAWRSAIVDAPDYHTVLHHLGTLKAMISEPVTRVLLKQVLARALVRGGAGQREQRLGLHLAGEVVSFAVPRIDVGLPAPTTGWELGTIDLARLKAVAATHAAGIPKAINTQASCCKPTTEAL